MVIQRDAASRFPINKVNLEALPVAPTDTIDGDVFHVKTGAANASIRFSIGGAVVKVFQDGEVTTGNDTTVRTILSDTEVV